MALHERMQQAIEDVTLAWVHEHDLYAVGHRVPQEIDREKADPAAKAMIADWAAAQENPCRLPPLDPDTALDGGPDHA
jgi:hypothetical protein